jgi:hypothetical protein
MDVFHGLKLYLERSLCERPFLRWARTHRKARIRKKWRKKYGPVFAQCPGKAIKIGLRGLIVCPCTMAALKSHTAVTKEK